MNCKQVRKSLEYGCSPTTDWRQSEVETHARSCETCGRELAVSKLMDVLISSYAAPIPEESPWDEVRLANGIKSRIHEMSERSTGSWEMGVIAVRGWLLAFGAAAVLLLALSNELATRNPSDQSDQISVSSAPLSEEIISSNSSSIGVFGEEPEHAQ